MADLQGRDLRLVRPLAGARDYSREARAADIRCIRISREGRPEDLPVRRSLVLKFLRSLSFVDYMIILAVFGVLGWIL